MRGKNLVILVGNLGKDPEIRYTQNDKAVCNFSLAVNERRKNGDDWIDHVEWVNCVAWGATAEAMAQHLKKGAPLHVEGRLQTRSWEDDDGNKRYSTEVQCSDVLFLGGKKESPTEKEESKKSAQPTKKNNKK